MKTDRFTRRTLVLFFTICMVMPIHSEGMGALCDLFEDFVAVISKNRGMALVTGLLFVQMIRAGEESDSDEEAFHEYYESKQINTSRLCKEIEKLAQEEKRHEVKKLAQEENRYEEKNQSETEVDDSAYHSDPIGLWLLWDILAGK